MEQYLRAFCNYEQDNWVELLPLGEFAYNNSVHASRRMTPFWANDHFHPGMQFKRQKAPTIAWSVVKADVMLAGLEETHEILRQNPLEAQTRPSKYAPGKVMIFKVGDKVLFSTRNIRTMRL